MGDEAFAALFFRVMDAAQALVRKGTLPQLPSFLEILTAQALLFFAEQEVELAVLEVGMGGRLDATNVVDPLLSIITDISLDHTEWLGATMTLMYGAGEGKDSAAWWDTNRVAAASGGEPGAGRGGGGAGCARDKRSGVYAAHRRRHGWLYCGGRDCRSAAERTQFEANRRVADEVAIDHGDALLVLKIFDNRPGRLYSFVAERDGA